MRTTLISISVLALLAAGAGPAAARPEPATGRTDAAIHAKAVAAQSLRDEQRAAVASSSPQIVRVTRVADGGFDWADAGIGAGLAAALLLSGAGVAAVRRQPPIAVR